MNRNHSKEFRNTSTGNFGTELLSIIQKHLPAGSSLLQLGLGSGEELRQLAQYYEVTGSDFSKLLLSVFQKSHPEIDLINLDPIELKTHRKFNCIYSNKVLHQMGGNELKASFFNQLNILNNEGTVIHSFWNGNKEEDHHGLKWIYYTEETLTKLIPTDFKLIDLATYKERIDHDSIYVVLKKK